MKLNGLSVVTDARKRLPEPFVADTSPPVPRMGKIIDGEEVLDKLWASGEIDNICSPSHSLNGRDVECVYCHTNFPERIAQDHEKACLSNPLVGLTEREYHKEVLGYTHVVDIRKDEKRLSLGRTQPTAKGAGILDSNVLELRAKYELR